jgi:putative ABC transport system substrate-binding protein
MIRRREFITLLGGTTLACPLAAGAQQAAQVRRIGVLMPFAEDHPVGQARVAAFLQGLRQLGWTDGHNVRIDYRWSAGDSDNIRKFASELIALGPDVVMAFTSAAVTALRQATSTVPIVFAVVADPVGAGYVESLARVAVLRDSAIAAGPGQFGALQAVAPSFGVELRPIDLHDPSGIEHGIAAFAKGPNNGLIVTGSPSATLHRNLIITLAARHKLPAIYYERSFADAGGLISYGPDFIDQCRRAAGYVDRILKGERPADLPVQAPTKYELVINLKTAKALGLQIPDKLLALADEVIE